MCRGQCRGSLVVGLAAGLVVSIYGVVGVLIRGWCRGHCEVGVGVVRGLYIRAIYSTSSLSSLLYIGPLKLSHCRSQNPSQRPPFYSIDNDSYQRSYHTDKEFTLAQIFTKIKFLNQ